MKKMLIIIVVGFSLTTLSVNSQVNLNTLGQGLSNEKIVKGLKEALSLGTNNSSTKASQLDGFYKNPLIKIPFPPEAKQMDKTLRQIGMGNQVDAFVKTLNRAAEDASKKAAPIFIKAITSMTITDGINILKGGNNAATEFLKKGTTPALKAEFKPVIKTSLSKVQITKYWKPLASKYNKMPFVKQMHPDLDEYVTNKSIEGLFKLIAEEEAKIRKDPKAAGSAVIQEVFGGKFP